MPRLQTVIEKIRPVSKHQERRDIEGGCPWFQAPSQPPGVCRRGLQNILPLAPVRDLGVQGPGGGASTSAVPEKGK